MHFPCTDLALEECPKWSALCEVLEEIREENSACDDPGRVLVAAADDRTCSQLKEVLCEGGRSLLMRLYNKTIALKQAAQVSIHKHFKRSLTLLNVVSINKGVSVKSVASVHQLVASYCMPCS